MVSIKAGIKKNIDYIQIFLVFALLFLFMSVTMRNFLSFTNLLNLLRQNAVALVLGAGVTLALISGEIDISVGGIIALSGVSAGLVSSYGFIVSIITALGVGLGFGLFNGMAATKGKIPSFIVTLSTAMMARSLAYVFTNAQVVSGYPDGWRFLGQEGIFGFPVIFIVVIIIYAFAYFMVKKTIFGQHIYAVGSNRVGAILCGINADWVKIKAMMFSGLLAGFGGILLSSRVMAMQADTATGMEFDVIAGVIIGGTSLNGGKGNLFQTIIGIFIIGMIRNAINLAHINIFWRGFVTGAIIIGAVGLDSLRRYLR